MVNTGIKKTIWPVFYGICVLKPRGNAALGCVSTRLEKYQLLARINNKKS